MDLTLAAQIAMTLSFVACIAAARWHVAPWLTRRAWADGLVPLLWVHAFRHVALQIFSAQRSGFGVPDTVRDQIVCGDVIGMLLALMAIFALRERFRIAIPLTWIFVLETVIDLANALIAGIHGQLLGAATGVTWLILTFYVPILWVSLGLIVWQLLRRPGDLRSAAPSR